MNAEGSNPTSDPKDDPQADPNGAKKQFNDELLPNSAADEFFDRMKHDFRRPKPSQEAVASALQAIQKLASDVALDHASKAQATTSEEKCPKCGASNTALNRFCGYCGAVLARSEKSDTKPEIIQNPPQTSAQPSIQHLYHHHYHHHYFPDSKPVLGADGKPAAELWADDTPISSISHEVSDDAETAIQKLIKNWSVCCNSKRLDDLVGLYSSDAIVLRPNVAPAHGSEGVRKLLQAALDSGLGDVELDCADIGIVGDFACLTGRSKMLVPVVAAKRREETGKYLIVARREDGKWKIVADSWCMDSPKVQSAQPSAAVLPIRAQRQ